MLEDFLETNIPRIIKQVEKGDESMSFLAIYSFIEGYFRAQIPKLKFEAKKKKPNGKYYDFKDILFEAKEVLRLDEHGKEVALYSDLITYHSSDQFIGGGTIETEANTNAIRHAFKKIKPGSLSVVVGQFIEFAQYRNFLTKEINEMISFKSVKDSRESLKKAHLTSSDSILQKQKNDLFLHYSEISDYRTEITDSNTELEIIDTKITNQKYEKLENARELIQLIRRKKELNYKIGELNSKLEELSEYIDFIQELAISLIEARSKENYEAKIIKLDSYQKEMINKHLPALTKKPGHSMLIKGGPGTGKTLVLIVMLFKLFSEEHKVCLLTYYPTLNKYISYLSSLYNDSELLKEFNIPAMSETMFMNLEKNIMKFDGFLLSEIRKLLNIKQTYPLEKNTILIMEICQSVEADPVDAEFLYKEITENILPKLLDEKDYCTTTKKKEQWPKILKIFEKLDNNNEMLDLYAYYKFGKSNIEIDEIFDYILIDEAQDLTDSQIFAINKFASKKGGIILAADPSQQIRNNRRSMAELGLNIKGGQRYSRELIQNYRSSQEIQQLCKKYRDEPCLKMRKDTKSDYCITAGPPPQLFVTNDTENTNYKDTYAQIISSVRMCTEELCIVPENICIVSFNEPELSVIQQKLKEELQINSDLIYKDKDFSFKNNVKAGNVRLCTLKEIKGIDCPVLMLMITDQSKQINNGNIKSEIKANAIYTCITRAMYLLQIFIPKYCRTSDLSVAVLVNKLLPEDEEVEAFVKQYRKKQDNEISLGKLKLKDNEEANVSEEELNKILEEGKFSKNYRVYNTDDLKSFYAVALKTVRDIVSDEIKEISLSDALRINTNCKIGDIIEVNINLNEELEAYNIKHNKSLVYILSEEYEKKSNMRTDENGILSPNSETGYLNINECKLPTPDKCAYKDWTDFIKNNSSLFDYITYIKNSTTIFAFKPKEKYINISELPSFSSIFVGIKVPHDKKNGAEYLIIKPQHIKPPVVLHGNARKEYCDSDFLRSIPDFQRFILQDGDILVNTRSQEHGFGIYTEEGDKAVAVGTIIIVRPNVDTKTILHNFFLSETGKNYFKDNYIELCNMLKISPNSSSLVVKEIEQKLRSNDIYIDTIIGPDYKKPGCIKVHFEDSEYPDRHSLEIWRSKNQNDLFSKCKQGSKVKYKVLKSDTGYLQAVVLEILD